jgi:hypothetical protein
MEAERLARGVLGITAMAAASHPGTGVLPVVPSPRALREYAPVSAASAVRAVSAPVSAPRSAEHPLLEMAVGRLLEWVVSSVEGLRDRQLRRGRR